MYDELYLYVIQIDIQSYFACSTSLQARALMFLGLSRVGSESIIDLSRQLDPYRILDSSWTIALLLGLLMLFLDIIKFIKHHCRFAITLEYSMKLKT